MFASTGRLHSSHRRGSALPLGMCASVSIYIFMMTHLPSSHPRCSKSPAGSNIGSKPGPTWCGEGSDKTGFGNGCNILQQRLQNGPESLDFLGQRGNQGLMSTISLTHPHALPAVTGLHGHSQNPPTPTLSCSTGWLTLPSCSVQT